MPFSSESSSRSELSSPRSPLDLPRDGTSTLVMRVSATRPSQNLTQPSSASTLITVLNLGPSSGAFEGVQYLLYWMASAVSPLSRLTLSGFFQPRREPTPLAIAPNPLGMPVKILPKNDVGAAVDDVIDGDFGALAVDDPQLPNHELGDALEVVLPIEVEVEGDDLPYGFKNPNKEEPEDAPAIDEGALVADDDDEPQEPNPPNRDESENPELVPAVEAGALVPEADEVDDDPQEPSDPSQDEGAALVRAPDADADEAGESRPAELDDPREDDSDEVDEAES